MDATMLLLQNSDDTLKIRYGIADSSPQKGHDWLLSAVDEINASDVLSCFRSFDLLVSFARGRAAGDGVDEAAERRAHETVYRSIRRVTNIPVALGQGATNLTHKVAALMYSWCCGRRRENLRGDILEYLSSYASFCADMGVELGIAEYIVGDLWTLLPEWFEVESVGGDVAPEEVDSSIVCDVMEEGEAEGACALVAVAPEDEARRHFAIAADFARQRQASSFLPLALTLPAVLHIVHNLLREVDTKLRGWADFWPKLKMLERLFKDGRRERFIRFCVMPTPLRDQASEFEAASIGHLYEERFGEVAIFCKQISRWAPLLRATWDEQRFRTGPGARSTPKPNDAEFDPTEMSNIMHDNGFFGYIRMLTEVHDIAQSLADWAEGCECHDYLSQTVASLSTRLCGRVSTVQAPGSLSASLAPIFLPSCPKSVFCP